MSTGRPVTFTNWNAGEPVKIDQNINLRLLRMKLLFDIRSDQQVKKSMMEYFRHVVLKQACVYRPLTANSSLICCGLSSQFRSRQELYPLFSFNFIQGFPCFPLGSAPFNTVFSLPYSARWKVMICIFLHQSVKYVEWNFRTLWHSSSIRPGRAQRFIWSMASSMEDLCEIVDYHHRTSTRRSTKVLGEISYLFCQNPLFNSSSIWAWPKHVSRVLLKSSTSCVNTAMLVGIVTFGVCNLRPWSSGRISLLINGWSYTMCIRLTYIIAISSQCTHFTCFLI